MKKILINQKPLLLLAAAVILAVALSWLRSHRSSLRSEPDNDGQVQTSSSNIVPADGASASDDASLVRSASSPTPPNSPTNAPVPSPLRLIQTVNTASEADLALSPDGTLLAGGRGRDVYLWDTARGGVKKKLSGHEKKVIATAFSPDGKLLVSSSADDAVIIWSVETAKIKQRLQNPERFLLKEWRPVAFSSDSKTLATHLSNGNGLRLWDLASGRPKDFPFSKGGPAAHFDVRNIAFSSTGLLGGAGGVLRYFNPASGGESKPVGFSKNLRTLAFSPDGKILVGAGEDFAVFVWDVPDGIQPARILIGYEEPISTLAFSRDGAFLAVATEKEVRLLSKEDWNLKATLPGHTWVAFTADSRVIATGMSAVKLWDMTTLKKIAQP